MTCAPPWCCTPPPADYSAAGSAPTQQRWGSAMLGTLGTLRRRRRQQRRRPAVSRGRRTLLLHACDTRTTHPHVPDRSKVKEQPPSIPYVGQLSMDQAPPSKPISLRASLPDTRPDVHGGCVATGASESCRDGGGVHTGGRAGVAAGTCRSRSRPLHHVRPASPNIYRQPFQHGWLWRRWRHGRHRIRQPAACRDAPSVGDHLPHGRLGAGAMQATGPGRWERRANER